MEKILIIEDDAMMARVFQQGLTLEGFIVEVARDGEEGIGKAKAVLPAFILLDVMMPKMNGFEVLEALKKDPSTKNIPVALLTNLSGEKDAETAIEKGAVAYIIKSDHEPKQVATMIKEILSKSK